VKSIGCSVILHRS